MDDNKSWVQIKVTCDSKDAEVVEGVMSMVDNGLMIEDYSDGSLGICLNYKIPCRKRAFH